LAYSIDRGQLVGARKRAASAASPRPLSQGYNKTCQSYRWHGGCGQLHAHFMTMPHIHDDNAFASRAGTVRCSAVVFELSARSPGDP